MRSIRILSALLTITVLGTATVSAQTDSQTNSPSDSTTPTPSTTTATVPAGPVVSPPADLAPPPPATTTSTPAPAPFNSDSHIPSTPNTPDTSPAPDTTTPSPDQGAPATITPSGGITTTPAAAPTATGPDPSIYDIRPPFFYLKSWLWLWITLAAAIVIGLLTWLLFWLWPNRQLSAKSAYELTLEKLEKARTLLQEENPEPYAVMVSETIRSYLGQRFQSPSTRRTTEEFLRIMEKNPATPMAAHSDLLREFLQSCDLLKFARYQPGLSELERVHQSAYSFVTATKPVPVAQGNGRHP